MTATSKHIYQSNFAENKLFFNKKKSKRWINEFGDWLFCNQNEYIDFKYFELKEVALTNLLVQLLKDEQFPEDQAIKTASTFFSNGYNLHQTLLKDLNAIFDFDPAARTKNEVLIAYSGFYAIMVYRVASELWQHNARILARLIAEHAHSKTGIDIHPAAKIGNHFMIDHGTGIVIGETAIIGNYVKIYQGVTLGALTVSKEDAQEKRHPTIEDGVTIYANATILGGKTIVGHDAIIGGNVWITKSIPPHSLVYHKSEITIKTNETYLEALNFSI